VNWQPIDTAPRDGTRVLVWWAYRLCADAAHWDAESDGGEWVGYFGDTGYASDSECTHWMPLPEPPK
jgi:hypothetical protein